MSAATIEAQQDGGGDLVRLALERIIGRTHDQPLLLGLRRDSTSAVNVVARRLPLSFEACVLRSRHRVQT